MASANLILAYWKGSGILWGVHGADTDAEITALQAFYAKDANTATVLVPRAGYTADSGLAAVAKDSGIPTPSDRCAVLDPTNAVVDVIKADPAMVDATVTHGLAHSLKQHDLAATGDRWNPQTTQFERLYSIADNLTRKVSSQAWLAVANPAPPQGMMLAPSAVAVGAVVPVKTISVSLTP